MKIELKHGAGGEESSKLIKEVFARYFANDILNKMEDGAVLPVIKGNPVFTSDSFVVEPLQFPGGNIGRLAICGTVNDLASMGAKPLYLTASFILETGLETELLEQVVASMAATAKEAGVQIVAGDTKVIEGKGGMFINTAGIGERPLESRVSASNLQAGDKLLVTGTLGDHHAVILAQRLKLQLELESDCAPLNGLVEQLLEHKVEVHAIRDITRGGLATVANELAESSQVRLVLEEKKIPVKAAVRGFCGILGLEPINMGNEGKMLLAVADKDAAKALELLQSLPYGSETAIIGEVETGSGVRLRTELGGLRRILPLRGEGLPRIC